MIYDKTRALEPGYYELFELCYKPALEKDRKNAARYEWLNSHYDLLLNMEGATFFRLRCGDSLDKWIDARVAELLNDSNKR